MGATQPMTYPNDSIHCIIVPTGSIGGIYISSICPAKDTILLQSLGIKAVLTSACEAADLKYDSSVIPFHLVIEGRDDYLFNLYDYFDMAVDWMVQQLRVTNVLVHCIGGRSRSASLIIAYLIRQKGMSAKDALKFMRQIRPQVKPNYGFKGQLKEYENKCRTQKGAQLSKNYVNGVAFQNMYGNNHPIAYRAY